MWRRFARGYKKLEQQEDNPREVLCPESQAETGTSPDYSTTEEEQLLGAGANKIHVTRRAWIKVDVCKDEHGEFTVLHVKGNPDYPTYVLSSFPLFRDTQGGERQDQPFINPLSYEEEWRYSNRAAAKLSQRGVEGPVNAHPS
jgi:hypothetical protein